ncbi:hypothetical protein [Acidovorax temperans]|uniref:hypothetical protein n=1 Tax=Acidovorax temperans TaxID=80878 RepID=UPI00289F5CCD|nr:hypothetical protein [Acidovorax temperans]
MQTEAVRKDIAGIEALIAEEPTLGPLRANWRELRADLDRATATTIEGATARQSFGAHTEVVRKLLSWMRDIGDVSGLAADASPALYHLNLTQAGACQNHIATDQPPAGRYRALRPFAPYPQR